MHLTVGKAPSQQAGSRGFPGPHRRIRAGPCVASPSGELLPTALCLFPTLVTERRLLREFCFEAALSCQLKHLASRHICVFVL